MRGRTASSAGALAALVLVMVAAAVFAGPACPPPVACPPPRVREALLADRKSVV